MGVIWRYARGLARALSWLIEISRLSFAVAAVAASRPPAPPPWTTAEAVRRDDVHSSTPRIEQRSIAAPASSPVPDEWRASLQSVTWALIGVTLVLMAVSAIVLTHA